MATKTCDKCGHSMRMIKFADDLKKRLTCPDCGWRKPTPVQAKRDQTLRNKLFDNLSAKPGQLAGDIPMAQRRFLREMEDAGALACRVVANEYRWFVAQSVDDYYAPAGSP